VCVPEPAGRGGEEKKSRYYLCRETNRDCPTSSPVYILTEPP